MSESSDGTINTQVSNQLAMLVPSFDPSKDDLQVYSQKVMLLLEAWPASKYTELATRLILNCSGSAFKKLQLHQSEITVNERKSIQRIIELLGGHWGQIDLEQRYEYAERALYKCQQKSDESADSYLARADIMWTELNSRKFQLSDLQAYVTLRGSTLSSDDKKRVLLDADAANKGSLTVDKVSAAIRMLGAGFFHEMTGGRRTQKFKTYDQTALMAEELEDFEQDQTVLHAEQPDEDDDQMVATLAQEGDEDASLVADFEAAASELLQNDEELAAAFTAYTDARRRLNDKVRNRGFWPIGQKSRGKGPFKGVKGKFSKGHPSSRKSLQQRIMESRCRLCGKMGHWKAECPSKGDTAVNRPPQAPTTFVQVASTSMEEHDDGLPLEFLKLPVHEATTLQKIQTPSVEARPDLSHLSMQDLMEQKISFGKTHQGRTFQEVWDHEQSWVSWFVQRFANSTKAEHVIFLKFVELKIERAELTGTPVPLTNKSEVEKTMTLGQTSGQVSHAGKAKAKAKTAMQIPVETSVWDLDEEDPELFEVLTEEVPAENNHQSQPRESHAGGGKCSGQHSPALGDHDNVNSNASVSPPECPSIHAMIAAGDPSAECFISTTHATHETNQERVRFQYSKELDNIMSQTHNHPSRLDVLEIFCGPQSQLTQQSQQLGLKAERFGLQQGDLQTTQGRHDLFKILCTRRPRNVWFSPKCGPWSGYSCLNGSKSIEAWDELQRQRMSSLEQIALGVVILRHQRQREDHFHWEQPRGSLMFKLPYLQEVMYYLLAVDVDLCVAGELKDPVNGKLIRKTLTILSTSHKMIDALSGLRCDHQHEHQIIEGQVYYQGQYINRSTFTENYPRKFARRLAKVLGKFQYPRELPYRNDTWAILAAEEHPEAPASKRPRRETYTSLKLSRVLEVSKLPWGKRRKLSSKTTPIDAKQQWEVVFTKVGQLLPRVGKCVIQDAEILQQVQNLIEDKQLETIVACRVASRTLAPPEHLVKGVAPYRRCIFTEMGTGEIRAESDWENWENLAKRNLIRPSHATHINITLFARDMPRSSRSSTHDSSEMPADVTGETVPMPENSSSMPASVESEEVQQMSPEDTNRPSVVAELSKSQQADLSSEQQCPRFKALPRDEQIALLRAHKNLGHPSPERLSTMLRENIRLTTISPEAQYQNGRAERHGAILKTMLTKYEAEQEINNYQDLAQALFWCTQAKNASSLKRGFAPEVLVLGKHTRLPGAVCSDELLPAHLLAESETAQGVAFRRQLACREAARRAFVHADNDAALRRAMLRRSRPGGLPYAPGEWVMCWRQDDTDDDLYCDGYLCHDVDESAFACSSELDLAWRCEVVVTEADIQAWKEEPESAEMAFVVSAAKKQRAEESHSPEGLLQSNQCPS
eukprot:s1772_g3.t1